MNQQDGTAPKVPRPERQIPVPVSEPNGAAPTPSAVGAADSTPAGEATPAPAAEKPAAKAKPPAVEDKPFAEFVPEIFLPALAKEMQAYGGPSPELSFEQAPMPVVGSDCWVVKGCMPRGRRFWLCFTTTDIHGPKTFSLAESGSEPTLLESFLIDERKATLPLLVSRVVSRLNGQKWLGPN